MCVDIRLFHRLRHIQLPDSKLHLLIVPYGNSRYSYAVPYCATASRSLCGDVVRLLLFGVPCCRVVYSVPPFSLVELSSNPHMKSTFP